MGSAALRVLSGNVVEAMKSKRMLGHARIALLPMQMAIRIAVRGTEMHWENASPLSIPDVPVRMQPMDACHP
jgi:hypothetical protein